MDTHTNAIHSELDYTNKESRVKLILLSKIDYAAYSGSSTCYQAPLGRSSVQAIT